jgi:hypothetical protein
LFFFAFAECPKKSTQQREPFTDKVLGKEPFADKVFAECYLPSVTLGKAFAAKPLPSVK